MCETVEKILRGTDQEAHLALLDVIKDHGKVLQEVRDSVKGLEQKFDLMEKGTLVLPTCKTHNNEIKRVNEKLNNTIISGLAATLVIVTTGIINFITKG